MCSMIDSGEKGYKLPEQILFNSLVLYLTLFFPSSNEESFLMVGNIQNERKFPKVTQKYKLTAIT